MTIIDVPFCNKSRLHAAEWAVWSANHKVKDQAHHVLDVVWVDPATLGIYLDIKTISEMGYSDFLEGDNPLLSEYTQDQWIERFANKTTRKFLIPIQCILSRPTIMAKLSSLSSDEILDTFLEIPGLPGFDQIYREYERDRKYTAGLRKCALQASYDSDHYEYDSDPYEYDSDDYEYDSDPLSAKIVTFLRSDPVYNLFITRIEQESYNRAVKAAINAIVDEYDYDKWLT